MFTGVAESDRKQFLEEVDKLLAEEDEESKDYSSLDTEDDRRVHFRSDVLLHAESLSREDESSIDPAAVQFGARISVILLISSLFVVIKVDGGLPQGGWVVVSSLMVSWFPSMDAASVIQKSMQRLMGTLSGGGLGLLLGLLCRQIQNPIWRSLCLEISFVTGAFFVCFLSMQLRVNRTTTFIEKYSYATSFILLTFSIALFPFYETKDPWKKAIFRVIDVSIGCVIGTLGSVVVLPRSTGLIIHQRISNQCRLAGEAAEAALHEAADKFSASAILRTLGEEKDGSLRTESKRLRDSVLKRSFQRVNRAILDDGKDVVMEKYESAIQDWRTTKGMFSLLSFDPFHYCMPYRGDYQQACAVALERSLRVQTTVVLMEGIIRNDRRQYFDLEMCSMFTEMGTLTRKMLNTNPNRETSEAAKEFLMERLGRVRKRTTTLAHVIPEMETTTIPKFAKSKRRRSILVEDRGKRDSLLFLQLVEHLILRCIALQEAWRDAAEIPAQKSSGRIDSMLNNLRPQSETEYFNTVI